jgi:uncharacterized membrane protein
MEEFGPVQILVIGFDGKSFDGTILPELRRLRELDIVRLIDLVAVAKDSDGDVLSIEVSDLSDQEAAEFGALAGALVGLGMDGEEGAEAGAIAGADAAADGNVLGDEVMWSVADAIPADSTAAVALIEHRWAIPLRDAIRHAGGVTIADTWVHPEDLVAAGAAMGAGA